jgi:hypothetical protein
MALMQCGCELTVQVSYGSGRMSSRRRGGKRRTKRDVPTCREAPHMGAQQQFHSEARRRSGLGLDKYLSIALLSRDLRVSARSLFFLLAWRALRAWRDSLLLSSPGTPPLTQTLKEYPSVLQLTLLRLTNVAAGRRFDVKEGSPCGRTYQ